MARGRWRARCCRSSAAPRAAADPNDLVLSRLATRDRRTPSGNVSGVVGQNLEFRALASQLGVVLAPHLLTPADTLGFGGFQFDRRLRRRPTIDATQPYWRALAGSPDPSGRPASRNGPGALRTVGFFARKGLWFPLPSFELGAGAVHLVDSHDLDRAALRASSRSHEGYHELPLPSVAVRGAVSRMMNQRELDLTVASLDVTVSKHFGIGGTWRLDPFAGWNLLMIVPRSEVIDATPNVDPLAPGNDMDAQQQLRVQGPGDDLSPALLRRRQAAVLRRPADARGRSSRSPAPRSTTARAPADACMPQLDDAATATRKDTATAQTTLSISAGFDF